MTKFRQIRAIWCKFRLFLGIFHLEYPIYSEPYDFGNFTESLSIKTPLPTSKIGRWIDRQFRHTDNPDRQLLTDNLDRQTDS